MRLHSIEETRAKLDEVVNEAVVLSENVRNLTDLEASIERLQALNPQLTALKARLENSEVDETDTPTVADSVGISVDELTDEATVGNVVSILGKLVRGIGEFYNSGISDADKMDVANQVAAVDGFNTLHFEVNSAVNGSRNGNGRSAKMDAEKAKSIRQKFHEEWMVDNGIKYPAFMKMHGITLQRYSLVSLIKGETYPDAGGPVRGTDFDVKPEADEVVDGVEPVTA
jgi:hypothetical protein